MKRQIYNSVKENATFISICFVAMAAMFAVAPPSLAQQPLGGPRRPPLQLPPDAPGQTKTDPAARTQQPKVGVAVQERINRNLNRKPFHKPSDPEAAALLLNLIARYAADVPDKTDLDRRIEASLGNSPNGRQIAQRIVDRFHNIPLQFRQEAYGQYANITTRQFERSRYETAFSRVFQSATKMGATPNAPRRYSRPMSLGSGSISDYYNYRLRYKGMACFAETTNDQASGSDEIYISFSVITFENGQPVTRTSMKGVYEPVDAGGTFPDAGAVLYEGPAQGLGMIAVMMEQDYGDAKEQRDMIDTMVKMAITAAYSVGTGTPPPAPVVFLIGVASKAIADLVVDILDLKDDLIEAKEVNLYPEHLMEFGSSPPSLNYQGILYHFDELHNGDGGMYRSYYDIERIVAPQPPPPPDFEPDAPEAISFLPAMQASSANVEGLWGNAKWKETSKITAHIIGTPSRSGVFKVITSERIKGGSDLTASAVGLQLTTDGTWNYFRPLYASTPMLESGGIRLGGGLGGPLGGVVGGPRLGNGRAPGGRVPGGQAYALILPNNIHVQVFIEDRPPGEVRNYRMRYVRLSDNGQVITDVMLRPAQTRPK